MSLILIASICIVFTIIFFGGFSGFVVGDMTENFFIWLAMAFIPASIIAIMLDNAYAFLLYGISYFLGLMVSECFRAVK
jgi:hypothetical protein